MTSSPMLKGSERVNALIHILSKKETRLEYCRGDLHAFAIYYFATAFSCKSAKFHKRWAILFAGNEHLLFIAFRESAKTFWLMVKFIHSIAYRTRRNMFYICYDKSTANERLFDIANALQTNPLLLADFGHLFPTFANGNSGPTKRAITQFITTNGIRCKALGLKGKVRGAVFLTNDGMFRPDFLGLDDIDVLDSVRSVDMIDTNYLRLTGEIFGALADNAQIICIGNVIKDDGLVLRLEKDMEKNPGWHVERIPVIDAKGKLAWPSRFTQTGEPGKIDLRKKRADQGEIAYNQNYLLIGFAGGESIIKRHYIKYERPPAKFDKVIIGIDPSYAEKKYADDFAIAVSGHVGDKIYVLEVVKLQGILKDIPKAIPIIKALYIKWRANYVNVETVTQEFILKAVKQAGMASRAIHPTHDKVTRLMEWQAMIEGGYIVFNPDNKGVNDLIANLLAFPNVTHDDDVDAMVYSFIKPKFRVV